VSSVKPQLLRQLGSLKQVREASHEALTRSPGCRSPLPVWYNEYFHPLPAGEDEGRGEGERGSMRRMLAFRMYRMQI